MLRSMYAGISGMKANQTKMDVVGNNVANVGTTAYKKSSVRFSDALYQNMIYSSTPGGGIGGVNPGQVGIGSKVSGIAKNTLQGTIQPTGIPTDLAIDGDGYFKVQLSEENYAYTRDGSFNLDANGNLVTSEGYYVLDKENAKVQIPKAVDENGEAVDAGTADSKRVLSYNISKEGKISYLLEDGSKMPILKEDGTIVTGTQQEINISVFVNPQGLEAMGGNLYRSSANSGEPIDTAVKGNINQGAIEMSNVDLSEEFTEMIVTTRAFQASSKVITTSDELLQEIINLKR